MTGTLHSYRHEFAKRAEGRREDERRADQSRQRQERDKREERQREADQEAFLEMVAVVMATDTELADFSVELDSYETATVEALMENEEQLRLVDKELQVLLDQAYVLPDGRRVFKTQDGTRVFDEHGVEVKDIDPDEIENWRPYWERYDEPFKRKFDLTEERKELLEFQEQTDQIEAEIADVRKHGGMSKDRLAEIRQKLDEGAPDAVLRKLGRNGAAHNVEIAPTPGTETASRPAAKLDMPAL